MAWVFPIFLTIFLAWNFSFAFEADILQIPASNNLGRVGSKNYSVARLGGGGNWTHAKTLCQEMGMTLAKIETVEEFNFLNSKHQSAVFNGMYWTSARDSHQPQQFVWDDNNGSITVDMPWRKYGELETRYLSCAAFGISAINRSDMFMVNCDKIIDYVLCEKVGTQTFVN